MQPTKTVQRQSWLRLLRSVLIAVPALIVIGPAAFGAQGTADNPSSSTALAAVDGLARSPFVLPSLDGPAYDLTRLRGRIVLVHFFATWCEPCRAEMASLNELQSRFEGRPLTIVHISVAEASGAVRRFFADRPERFDVLLDQDRAVARAWDIHTLPSTVVLDEGLKARYAAEGDVDWGQPEVLTIIAQLLLEVPR